jgi:uncharacterized OsmC-like protein
MSNETVTVRLAQRQNYQFDVQFSDGAPSLHTDEPPPMGEGTGPSPTQLLATAVGNCLSASLLFSLRKYKQEPQPLSCEVQAEVGRNAEGRLRVLRMTAALTLGEPAAALAHVERAVSQFEAFCTVTQSVGQGIDITVQVFDSTGAQLK